MDFYSFAINLSSYLHLSNITDTSFHVSQITTNEALMLRNTMESANINVRIELIGSSEWRVVS